MLISAMKNMASGKVSALITYSQVTNNLTTTAAGGVLDARQGKVLYDKFYRQVANIDTTIKTANRTSVVSNVIKCDQICFINLEIVFTTAVTTGDFALIPTGYRPKANRVVPMIFYNNSGEIGVYCATIKSTGYVNQVSTSTLKGCVIVGAYQIE